MAGQGIEGLTAGSIQTGSGAHPAYYPMGNGEYFLGGGGKCCRGVKLTVDMYLVPTTNMLELYRVSHIRLYGVILN
jgi:hypothetical protein